LPSKAAAVENLSKHNGKENSLSCNLNLLPLLLTHQQTLSHEMMIWQYKIYEL